MHKKWSYKNSCGYPSGLAPRGLLVRRKSMIFIEVRVTFA